jgi:CheY-like chemotaxis protein
MPTASRPVLRWLDDGRGRRLSCGVCSAPQAGPLILVVDDDPTIRETFAAILASEGYEVIAAADGLDALEAVRQQQPDLILTDVAMPRLDGAGFCHAYRAEGGAAPVILVSAATAELVAATAEACGAVGHLLKPFGIDELLETVARHLVA